MTDSLAVTDRLSKLEVSATTEPDLRQPTTPCEIPSNIDVHMNEWLNDVLGSVPNSTASSAKLYAKILVSNVAAGSIIGKAGGNINDFQSKTYARIQLSKASEYYPGTSERTLLVTGQLKQIIAALSLIFEKLLREGVAPLSPRTRDAIDSNIIEPRFNPSMRLLTKFLVPQPLCGIIIGRGGTTVRNFSNETQTHIRVTASETPTLPLNHRIVNINGSADNVLRAIALLILKQTEDPKFPMFSELPSSYISQGTTTPPGMNPIPLAYSIPPITGIQFPHYIQSTNSAPAIYPASATNEMAPAPYAPATPEGMTSMIFPITEDQASILLGQDGNGLDEFQSGTGVRIQIADTQDGPNKGRSIRVTVSGMAEAVHYTHYLMSQKLMGIVYRQQYTAAPAAVPAIGMFAAYHPHHPHLSGAQFNGTTYYTPNFGTQFVASAPGLQFIDGSANGLRPSPRTITPRQQGEN